MAIISDPDADCLHFIAILAVSTYVFQSGGGLIIIVRVGKGPRGTLSLSSPPVPGNRGHMWSVVDV